MIGVNQLAAALYGLWLLLKFDPRGFAYFEKTPEGFARSFMVAALTAPLWLMHAALVYPHAKSSLAYLPFMIVQLLSFVIGWVGFPFVMLYLSALLLRRERYFWQMVPYNWLQIGLVVPFFTLALLADVHLIGAQTMNYLGLVPTIVSFIYGIFIARVGLQVGFFTATGLTLLDQVLSKIVSDLINAI